MASHAQVSARSSECPFARPAGFYHAVDWSEPWLKGLLAFHVTVWVLAIATRKLNDVQIVMLLSIRAPHRPCLLTLILALALTCCSVSVRRTALAYAQPSPGACGASPQCRHRLPPTAYRLPPTAAYRLPPLTAALRPELPPHLSSALAPAGLAPTTLSRPDQVGESLPQTQTQTQTQTSGDRLLRRDDQPSRGRELGD